MSQAIQDLSARMWLWRVAFARLFVHCFIIGATMYLSSMGNQHWSELDGDSRFKLFLGIVVSMFSTLQAFLDKTTSKIADGTFTPPDTGDTATFVKTDFQLTTEKTINETKKTTINPLTDKPLNP